MVIRRNVNPLFYEWYKSNLEEIMDRDEFDNLQAAFIAGCDSKINAVCDCYISVPSGNYPDLCAHCGKKARKEQ